VFFCCCKFLMREATFVATLLCCFDESFVWSFGDGAGGTSASTAFSVGGEARHACGVLVTGKTFSTHFVFFLRAPALMALGFKYFVSPLFLDRWEHFNHTKG
jgi:hypothetical protein